MTDSPTAVQAQSATIDFNGRTVLVTGASGGIGGATVRQLAAAGADVIASGRSPARWHRSAMKPERSRWRST